MGNLFKLKEVVSVIFDKYGIDESDKDWIVSQTLNLRRSELAINRELTKQQIKKVLKNVRKRCKGVPLTQIFNSAEFYGYDLFVNSKVLSPRPETELLVETVLKEKHLTSGLDIGTGSGAISIVIAKNSNIKMTAVDISRSALKVAKKNAKKYDAQIEFKRSNLFSSVKDRKFDFVVSNPPYIKTEDIITLDKEVKDYEPHLALDGGNSGLEFYKKITEEAKYHLNSGGLIFFEIGIGQSGEVKELLEKDFCDIEIIKDYNKIDRIIKARLKEIN